MSEITQNSFENYKLSYHDSEKYVKDFFKNECQFTRINLADSSYSSKSCKSFKLDNNGILKNSSDEENTNLYDGKIEKITINRIADLKKYLTSQAHDSVLIHGIPVNEASQICTTTQKETKFLNNSNYIARNKASFQYPDSQLCLAMFDVDIDQEIIDRKKAISIIRKAISNFKVVDFLVSFSSSSYIYNKKTESVINSNKGFHCYFLIHPKYLTDIKLFTDSLMWYLKDYIYIKISSDGKLLTRNKIIDVSVFSPERVDFVAPPQLDSNLFQRKPPPQLFKSSNRKKHALLEFELIDNEQRKNLQEYIDKLKDDKRFSIEKNLHPENTPIEVIKKAVKQRKQNELVLDELSSSTLLTLKNGNTITIADALKEPATYCNKPIFVGFDTEKYGNKISGYLNLAGGNASFFDCGHGGRIYKITDYQQDKFNLNDNDFSSFNHKAVNLVKDSDLKLRIPLSVGQEIINNDGFFVAKFPKGTGKNFSILNNLSVDCQNNDKSLLIITPLINLVNKICSDTHCLDYRVLKSKHFDKQSLIEGNERFKGICTCVNSLESENFYNDIILDCYSELFDCIYIDEISSILNSLIAPNDNFMSYGMQQNIITKLRTLFINAKKVVLCDADVNSHHLSLIQALFGIQIDIVYSSINQDNLLIDKGKTLFHYENGQTIKKIMLERLENGENIIFCTDNKDLTERYHKLFKNLNYKGILINSNNRKQNQFFVANISENIHKYQYLIYSPSLSTGASIDASYIKNESEHFDDLKIFSNEVFGIYNNIVSSNLFFQMLSRNRNWQFLHLYLKNSYNPLVKTYGKKNSTKIAIYEDVRQQIFDLTVKSRNLLNNNFRIELVSGDRISEIDKTISDVTTFNLLNTGKVALLEQAKSTGILCKPVDKNNKLIKDIKHKLPTNTMLVEYVNIINELIKKNTYRSIANQTYGKYTSLFTVEERLSHLILKWDIKRPISETQLKWLLHNNSNVWHSNIKCLNSSYCANLDIQQCLWSVARLDNAMLKNRYLMALNELFGLDFFADKDCVINTKVDTYELDTLFKSYDIHSNEFKSVFKFSLFTKQTKKQIELTSVLYKIDVLRIIDKLYGINLKVIRHKEKSKRDKRSYFYNQDNELSHFIKKLIIDCSVEE